MASLAQNGKYDSINTNNPKTMVYSVLNYVSDDYVLHEYTTCAGEIETTGKPFSTLNILPVWNKRWSGIGRKTVATNHSCSNKNNFTFMSRCFCSERVQDTPRSVWNINQALKSLKIQIIFSTNSFHDYIIDEILCQYQIEYKININIEDTDD